MQYRPLEGAAWSSPWSHHKIRFKVILRKMLANNVSHWAWFGNSQLVIFYIEICLAVPMLSQREYFHFCGTFFLRNGNQWSMTPYKFFYVFRQTWTCMKKGIEMLFLNDYLDGTVRKRKCHLKGHKYPSHWVSKKLPPRCSISSA